MLLHFLARLVSCRPIPFHPIPSLAFPSAPLPSFRSLPISPIPSNLAVIHRHGIFQTPLPLLLPFPSLPFPSPPSRNLPVPPFPQIIKRDLAPSPLSTAASCPLDATRPRFFLVAIPSIPPSSPVHPPSSSSSLVSIPIPSLHLSISLSPIKPPFRSAIFFIFARASYLSLNWDLVYLRGELYRPPTPAFHVKPKSPPPPPQTSIHLSLSLPPPPPSPSRQPRVQKAQRSRAWAPYFVGTDSPSLQPAAAAFSWPKFHRVNQLSCFVSRQSISLPVLHRNKTAQKERSLFSARQGKETSFDLLPALGLGNRASLTKPAFCYRPAFSTLVA